MSKDVDRLAAVRAAIVANQQQQLDLEGLPQSLSDAKAALTESLNQREANARQGLTTTVRDFQRLGARARLVEPGFDTRLPPTESILDLLVLLHRATIEPLLIAEIEAQWKKDLPSAAKRHTTLAQLQKDLHKLEIEEEQIIRRLEAAGEIVDRRADARPAIVLSEG